MTKAVFIQNPVSIYADRPGEAYHFPKRYLKTVQQTVGDWVVFYESRKGRFGYVGVQKVLRVEPDPTTPDHYFAFLDRSSQWDFEQVVARADRTGKAYELSLRGENGAPISGGVSVSAVRKLTELEFSAILNDGLAASETAAAIPRLDETADPLNQDRVGFAEEIAPFVTAPIDLSRNDILMSRKYRDPSFRRQVLTAYDYTCAISGLSLRNGGGRAEVEAAHIRAVKDHGPDTVQNGLALSGTLHWMFDRGLISVGQDFSILVSHNKVPKDTADRLIGRDRKLILPADKRCHPHRDYLAYHREHVFGALS